MTEKPITKLLQELRGGGRDSLDEILPLVYDELRRLANSYLNRERDNHTLQPTALVHEAYLRLLGQKEIEWQNRAHFFGISARLMREILIEYARGRNRQKRGGEYKTQIALNDAVGFNHEEQFDVIVVRRRDKSFQVVAGQGDAAQVRRQLLGAHDGEHAQFQVVPHALDGMRAWCCR